MKQIDFRGLDQEIHRRIYGAEFDGATCPAYSREGELARRTVDLVNDSGRYRVYLKRVIGANGPETAEWQCEVFTPDGVEVLATEIDGEVSLAICRAFNTADVRLLAH